MDDVTRRQKRIYKLKKAIKMKWILITLAFMLAMTGCSEPKREDTYIGNWAQLHAEGLTKMNARIAKIDNGYSVEISLPMPNQPPVVIKKTGKVENGVLRVDGMEKIRFNENSGHLMIGANEFELVK
jgi:hypothetical protein